jgi:hypothetical protein
MARVKRGRQTASGGRRRLDLALKDRRLSVASASEKKKGVRECAKDSKSKQE